MINVKRYDIDYTKFATERVPQHVQEAEHISWVVRLISPLVFIYNQLLAFRQSIAYKILITPQVCFLEKLLNDRYDSSLRRIYILDGKEFNSRYMFTKPELKPFYIRVKSENTPVYIYNKGESFATGFDFVVFYPVALSLNINEAISLISSYKLASKTFSIQPI